MRPMGRQFAAMLIVVAVGVSAGGCWDNVDPRNRAFVTAIGLDVGPDGLLEATFQLPSPGQLHAPKGGGGEGGGARARFLTIQGRGRTFLEARAGAQAHIDRQLYLGQANLIVFGRGLLQQGLLPVANELARTPDIVTCYFAAAERARDILTFVPRWEPLPGVYVRSFYESVKTHGRYMRVPLWKVYRDLRTPGVDPVLPVISVAGDQIGLGGTVVLSGDRFAGFLDEEETRGLSWLLGSVRDETVTVEVDKRPYSLYRVEGKTRLHLQSDRAGQKTLVTVRVTGEVGAAAGTDSQLVDRIERAVDQFVAKEISRTMARLEEMRSDPARFEARLRDQSPWTPTSAKRFRPLPLPNLTVQVTTYIYGMGMRR